VRVSGNAGFQRGRDGGTDGGECSGPAPGQGIQVRQGRSQARLVENGEPPRTRPQHQGRPAVGALEGGAFVTSRLMEMLLVGLQVFEDLGRTEFVLRKGQVPQCRLAAVGTPPVRQGLAPIVDLAHFEVLLVLVLLRPPSVARTIITGVFGAAALLNRDQRQMEVTVGCWRGRDEYGGDSGIRPFQGFEGQFRWGVGMFQGIEQLFGGVVIRSVFPSVPLP